jgi:two-component system chemotaxis response regulator CheY
VFLVVVDHRAVWLSIAGLEPILKRHGAWRSEMRILCVDDSPAVQDMLAATLTRAGWDVLQAANGKAALELLECESVDVIISDVDMTVMGGFEFATRVRQDPAHEFTPILFLTTEDSDEFKDVGLEVGATGWICNPFDSSELIGVIRRISDLT